MSKNYLRIAIVNYVAKFLKRLGDSPFEYYYLNKNYPECTIDNLTDKEISYRYPLSGERFMLDLWDLSKEHQDITDDDWQAFLRVMHSIVKEVEQKKNEKD